MKKISTFIKSVISGEKFVESDVKAVVVAEIYLPERVLFGGRDDKTVKWRHISYLEDIELFKQYNWGYDCFNEFLTSLRCVFNKGTLIRSSSYSTVGFTFGFLFWVIHIFEEYRSKNVDILSPIKEPLMLSYKITGTP
ncbi:hypothetical protein HAX54_034945 [Datura stramonium]|uniref:DUF1985 domain-containing protein n=1 Tax=Datura stramonium TaxID=4076 RepID=A0ABS8VHW5_DATST|nr:hypothetical protein [Datura stramonium]